MDAAAVATEIIESQIDATVAAGAATVAVIAADAATVAAEMQIAQVTQNAAEKIGEAENAIAQNEDGLSWLKQKTETLEASLSQQVEKVSSLEAQILALTLSQVSTSPIRPEVPEIVGTPPESAVAPPEAEVSPPKPREKNPLRLL